MSGECEDLIRAANVPLPSPPSGERGERSRLRRVFKTWLSESRFRIEESNRRRFKSQRNVIDSLPSLPHSPEASADG